MQYAEAYLHSGRDLLFEFEQLLVALLDLLIQCLILNLQLLKVDQVQALGKLLLLSHLQRRVGRSPPQLVANMSSL